MEVVDDGKISVHVSLRKYERFFSNPIMLNVLDNGELHGDIYLWRFGVGSVEGSFSPSGMFLGASRRRCLASGLFRAISRKPRAPGHTSPSRETERGARRKNNW